MRSQFYRIGPFVLTIVIILWSTVIYSFLEGPQNWAVLPLKIFMALIFFNYVILFQLARLKMLVVIVALLHGIILYFIYWLAVMFLTKDFI